MKTLITCLLLLAWLTPAQAKAPVLLVPWKIEFTFQKENSTQTRKYNGKQFWKNGTRTQPLLDWTCEFRVPTSEPITEGVAQNRTIVGCHKKDGTMIIVQASCMTYSESGTLPASTLFSLGRTTEDAQAVHIAIMCGVK